MSEKSEEDIKLIYGLASKEEADSLLTKYKDEKKALNVYLQKN